MSEITSSNWDETAANNNAGSPNGWPENMNPSGVNDSAREMMSALKREYNRSHATKTSAGAASLTFTVSYSVNPAAYARGDMYSFKAHQNCGNAARFGISGLATKLIMKPTKGGLVTISQSDIVTDQIVQLTYDTSLDAMVMTSMIGLPSTIGSVQMVIAGAGLSGGSISSSGTIALDLSALTVTSSVSLSDFIPFYDGTNQRRATVTNIVNKHIASAAEMEAETAGRLVTAGLAARSPSAAKAWALFDGTQGTATCTFAVAYNVTSIVKLGTGRFQINFTTAFSSSNYIILANSEVASTLRDPTTSQSSTFAVIRTQNAAGAATDSINTNLVCFGDQ